MQKSTKQFKIFIIVASTRPGRVGRAIADWFYTQAKKQQSSMQFELVDLIDWNLPLLDESIPAKAHMYQHEHTKRWGAKISEADGYVIVTPEYNHGYPASLKNALDYLYHEWSGKSVAFVSYGMGGGRLAVQQLQQVVVELQMQPLSKQVSITFHHDMFNERHQLVHPEKSLAKYINDSNTLIEALASTLRKGGAHKTA